MPCPLVTAFMARIEKNYPIESAIPRQPQFKSSLGEVLRKSLTPGAVEPHWRRNNRSWDWVSDNLGFWGDLIEQNKLLHNPTTEELLARVQYSMQLAVNELQVRGSPVVRRYPIQVSDLEAFEKSLTRLLEELQFAEDVAVIGKKRDGASLLHGTSRSAVRHIREMFENLGNAGGVGRHLADTFTVLILPRDMALKTVRKLLSL